MELHDHGLTSDLDMMRRHGFERRQVMRWLLAGAATLPLMSCGGGSAAAGTASGGASTGTAGTETAATPGTGACMVIPEETGGPYPADGTNTNGGSIINVLNQSGV
ncbi:MAG: intradiol ring-cleavage dioxygenase, partial [Janthinobacterium sp.]